MIGEITPSIKAPRQAVGRGNMLPPAARMTRHEKAAEKRITTALNKLRLDLMRGVTDENVQFLPSRLGYRDILQPFLDVVIDVLKDIADDGVVFGQGQVERFVFGTSKRLEVDVDAGFGMNWDLAHEAAEDWARQYGFSLVGDLNGTTRRRLQKEISAFVTNGETINQLSARLAKPNGPFGPTRAKRIAVTETTRAFAQGNLASWEQSGVIEGKRWNTSVDELVCPLCGPLHNVVVPLRDEFPNGGGMSPPRHVQCRCGISPTVVGSEERETGLEQFDLGES